MSRNFVVIYEAPTDFIVATEIADRVLQAEIDWLDEALLGFQRRWVGELPTGIALTWKSIPNLARSHGVKVHGHFDGAPGLPDAQAARRAIVLLLKLLNDLDAILMVRDVDDQGERKLGLDQARELFASQCKIVIGAASCEMEAWVITGFDPGNEGERVLLSSERQSLGFDPRLHSHQLTAGKDDTAVKSPKRVLQALTKGDWNRKRTCWQSTSLASLRDRGTGNGLANYLSEISEYLVPLITGQGQKRSPDLA